MSARILATIARGAAAALLLAGCLPGDTRPPPGTAHLLVEPSAAVIEGVTTADGWHITFEKLLVGIGGAAVYDGGSSCIIYTYSSYDRLYDLTVPGKQKLADIYALGTCSMYFHMGRPSPEALLGKGVTAKDLAFMLVEDGDAVVPRGYRSVYLRGRATREAVTKTFEWTFRDGSSFFSCGQLEDGPLPSWLDLHSGAELPLLLKIHGEELFHERAGDESPLRFDALAGADIDGDQAITLEELLLVPGPEPEADGGLSAADGGAPSLAHFLYYALLPRMVRIGDRVCNTHVKTIE